MGALEKTCRTCGTPKVALSSGILRCPVCRRRRWREYYHKSELHRSNMRRAYLMRKYGMSMEELEGLLDAQSGRCAICRKHWTECSAAKRSRYGKIFLQHLYVDHNHETGLVRGLLCNNCNTGIALFSENENCLRSAIAYLRKHGAANGVEENIV